MFRYMDATSGMGTEEISAYCKKVNLNLFNETVEGRSCRECDNWIFTKPSSNSEEGGVCCAMLDGVDEDGYSRWKKTYANSRCLLFKEASSEEVARRHLLQRHRAMSETESIIEMQIRCSRKGEPE